MRWKQARKMTLTTTHRHDYRWPNADCFVPNAEALTGQCGAGGHGGGGAERPPGSAQPFVCRDSAPTAVERPWCRRGPLPDAVARRDQPTPDAQMRHAQGRCNGSSVGLQHPQTSKPWSNVENPELKRRPQPKGCEGAYAQVTAAARVGEAPHQEPSFYDQPNQYISKLCDEHPRPTAVVTAAPRDELKRRVYADRYRTTYQSDYCTNADNSARLVGECDTHDPDTNSERPRQGECGCRVGVCSGGDAPRIRPIARRPKAVSDNFHFSCCTPKKRIGTEDEVGPPQKILPWASEYTDGIGRMGQMILEQKLLHPKKKKDIKY